MVDLALAQGVFRVYLGWCYFGVLQRDSKVLRFVAVLVNSSSNTANYGEYVQDMVRRVIVLLDTFGSFGAVLSKCKNAMRHRYIVCLQFAKKRAPKQQSRLLFRVEFRGFLANVSPPAIHMHYMYIYIYNHRRKFRNQTSENMDTWKAEMGRVREENKKEKVSEERRSRSANR